MKKSVILMMYLALAVVLSALETIILPASIIPGIKLGVANLVIIIILFQFGYKEAIFVSILRVILISIILGTLFSPTFFISFLGMVVSSIGLIIAYKINVFSPIGVSVVSSVFHIIGQVIAVVFIIEIPSIVTITPYLVYLAILTGFINGAIAIKVLKAISHKMEVNYEF